MLTNSDLYSDAHPYYVGADDDMEPTTDGKPTTDGVAEPEQETKSDEESVSFAQDMLTNGYVQKMALFFVVLAVVMAISRKVKQPAPSNSPYMDAKVHEKSMA